MEHCQMPRLRWSSKLVPFCIEGQTSVWLRKTAFTANRTNARCSTVQVALIFVRHSSQPFDRDGVCGNPISDAAVGALGPIMRSKHYMLCFAMPFNLFGDKRQIRRCWTHHTHHNHHSVLTRAW